VASASLRPRIPSAFASINGLAPWFFGIADRQRTSWLKALGIHVPALGGDFLEQGVCGVRFVVEFEDLRVQLSPSGSLSCRCPKEQGRANRAWKVPIQAPCHFR